MNKRQIIIFTTMALAVATASADQPATAPMPTQQIEDNLKRARDEYQKAVATAIDRLEGEKRKAISDGDHEKVGKIADLIVKLKGPLVKSGAIADKELDSMFSGVEKKAAPIAWKYQLWTYEWKNDAGDWISNKDGLGNKMWFFADGTMLSDYSEANPSTWRAEGNKTSWKSPSGHITTVNISSDGKQFQGTDSSGVQVKGTLIGTDADGVAPPPTVK